MSITRDLRDLASRIAALPSDGQPHVSDLLDLANRVERLEGNMLYLLSITCVSADKASSRKTTPTAELKRQHHIMTCAEKMVAGIPAWSHPTTDDLTAWIIQRSLTYVKTTLAERNNK